MQQVEQAKKTLETVFIEIIEAIKSNTGPVAEKLLNEYSLRSYVCAFINYAVFFCMIPLVIKCKKMITESNKSDDQIIGIIGLLSGIITMIITIFIGTCSLIDAVSPLYSIIKSLR